MHLFITTLDQIFGWACTSLSWLFFLKKWRFSLGAQFIFKFECPSFKCQWRRRKNLNFQTSSKKCRISDKHNNCCIENKT
jgi:hypothetical protein